MIYASMQNWSSDLNESKVGVQIRKKRGLEKLYSSTLTVLCSQVFFFLPVGQLSV